MEVSAREVFGILANQNAQMLRACLFSAVRRPQDVDDLFQEVLIEAWKSLPTYDRAKPFAPWLRAIAYHVVADWRHAQARRSAVICDPATLELVERHFEKLDGLEGDTWKERTSALRACLAELEPEDRQVIDLRYRDGLGCGPIGESLAKGVEWVKKRLQRARAQLAMCVEGKFTTEGERP